MLLTQGAADMIDDTKQNPCVLSVTDMTITADNKAILVDNLSYQLHQSQTLAIVGESGSGKSIASLALLGLLPNSLNVSGQVLLDGRTQLPITNNQGKDYDTR